ncbi:unannotated protein [freshwater metagenome]|uniref:Unannotated protein n=1 Tax=freshwater metagenome TaxID=449393 RepID=A0A6J7H1D4_9ZZZZ
MSSTEPPLLPHVAAGPNGHDALRADRPDDGAWTAADLAPHEREKHDRTLAACGPGPFGAALLLGTGHGALPALLADRCAELLAVDPSATDVAIAHERLPGDPRTRVVHGALPDDLPRVGSYDLVVAADVLCRLPEDDLRRLVDRLPRLLRTGARVVAVHWSGQAPDLERTAAEAHRALCIGSGLRPADLPAPPGTRGHLLDAFDVR